MNITLTGTKNGINTTFTATSAFRLGTAWLNYNGSTYQPDDVAWGLTESSTTVVVLNSAPGASDEVFLEAEPFSLVAGSVSDPGYRGIQEVEYGAASQTITCWPEVEGVLVDPTSATVIVMRAGQDTTNAQIPSTTATEDGTTHQLSHTFSAADTTAWPLTTDSVNRAKWTWVYGGKAYTTTTTFEVVRQPLIYNCPVRYDDVLKGFQGNAEALTQDGESATTVAQKYIMQAWADVLQWVRSKGKRPALTTGKEGLERVTYYRALVLMYRAHREGDDSWSKALESALKDYEVAKTECVLQYREDDQNTPQLQRAWQQTQFLVGNDMSSGALFCLPWRSR